MREIKRSASLLVKHILFNGSITQKGHALFKRNTISANFCKLGVEKAFLLLKLDTRIETIFAMIGVEAEIAKKRSRNTGKIKRPRMDLRFCLVHISASFPDILQQQIPLCCRQSAFPHQALFCLTEVYQRALNVRD
ncbi:Uncharacterised protein [Brucella abortus]|nr:Uncharacterised protein [Brucella abortus]